MVHYIIHLFFSQTVYHLYKTHVNRIKMEESFFVKWGRSDKEMENFLVKTE